MVPCLFRSETPTVLSVTSGRGVVSFSGATSIPGLVTGRRDRGIYLAEEVRLRRKLGQGLPSLPPPRRGSFRSKVSNRVCWCLLFFIYVRKDRLVSQICSGYWTESTNCWSEGSPIGRVDVWRLLGQWRMIISKSVDWNRADLIRESVGLLDTVDMSQTGRIFWEKSEPLLPRRILNGAWPFSLRILYPFSLFFLTCKGLSIDHWRRK